MKNLSYQLAIWLAASIVQRASNACIQDDKEWLDLAIQSAEDCLAKLKEIKKMED